MTLTPEEILAKEFSEEFVQGMRNRIVVGFLRYGPSKQNVKIKAAVVWLEERLEMYQKTGNTEFLVDIANFAMLEFMFPSHQEAHYHAGDRVRSKFDREWTIRGLYQWFYRKDGD